MRGTFPDRTLAASHMSWKAGLQVLSCLNKWNLLPGRAVVCAYCLEWGTAFSYTAHKRSDLPTAAAPTTTFCINHNSAISSSLALLHFLPVQILVPAEERFGSFESLHCSASLVWANLISSIMLLKGSWSVLCFLHRAALLRLCGILSHLQSPLHYLHWHDGTCTPAMARGCGAECMFIFASLKLMRESRLVHLTEQSLKLLDGCLDGCCISEALVKKIKSSCPTTEQSDLLSLSISDEMCDYAGVFQAAWNPWSRTLLHWGVNVLVLESLSVGGTR